MCGRATLISPAEDIAELFGVEATPTTPRYNIAPSTPLLTVRAAADGHRELHEVRWGLVPWWAKPADAKKLGSRFVQARVETVETTAAYRDAFKRHRCLVVVDGFFEWKTEGTNARGKPLRLPFHVRLPSGKPFAIAGLWDRWKSPEGEVTESCAVVTMPARGPVSAIHDRMPLVLLPEEWDAWTSGAVAEAHETVRAATSSEARGGDLVVVPVSTWVNNVRHDDPQCLEPRLPGAPIGAPFTT